MSDERLERIETTVRGLAHGQEALHAGQDELHAGQGELRTGLDELRAGLGELRAGQDELRAGLAELRTHMGVLHEEIIDRIKAIADPSDQLRREMRAGDNAVRESCERRLDAIEVVVKDHSAQLKQLRKRRP